MIDLNEASEQKDMGSGNVIPPDSVVMLKLSIRQPGEFAVGSHPALTITKNGKGEYLGVDVSVVGGTYEGRKWVEAINVKNDNDTAVKIGMAMLRAIVEAARGIKPQDQSPQAAAQRRLANDFWDFDGMVFPAKIGCEESQDGNYMNNKIRMIITPDKPEYDQCSAMGEIVSNKPVPELRSAKAPAAGGASTWAGGGAGTPPPASAPAAPGKPAWAK